MSRIFNKNKSKLILGIEKVIDRQNAKQKFIEIRFNTYSKIYKNKSHVDLGTLPNFYFPLTWHPLKYVIKKVAHTYYTYTISNTPISQQAVKNLRRKQQNKK